MDEIEAIKAVADALAKLPEEERGRVLAWANAKFGSVASAAALNTSSPTPDVKVVQSAIKPKVKVKSTKKPKTVIAMDKSLNLTPKGKISAIDFASKKAPTNVMQKCVVAVYYLRDTLELSEVTVSGVLTFFKTLSWPVPANLKNALAKSGTEGWLDTANLEDVKLTSMGENLIEHNLPQKPKK
jgi:hypothetical protein